MKYSWTPQKGTQLRAITATWCEELFFGGARGGGKSDYLLGDFAQDVNIYKNHWHGLLFRRVLKEMDELIKRSKDIFTPMGAVYKIQKNKWIFPNGATLSFAAIERDQDVEKYQGHQYPWIGGDELPNYPTDFVWTKLKACNRSAFPIPYKRMRASGNPGGAGQGWIKERFITPNPEGFTPIKEVDYININTGVKLELKEVDKTIIADRDWKRIESTRMFIPSRLQDNKILMENDPFYIAKLAQAGGKELVKAWLAGDWNAIEGAYFDDWDKSKHVVDPFIIPDTWYKIRAFDWGYSAPFCVLWGAISDGSLINTGTRIIYFPKGSLVIYREYYGTTGKPNEGLKINANEIATEIKNMQLGEQIDDQVADPAIFDVSVGVSINEQMNEQGIFWRPADNKRVPGWQQIRTRLKGIEGKPLIFIMSSCASLIRTIPIMQYDKAKPEDLDTRLEDHALDTLRYMCMSRPLTIEAPKQLSEISKQWWKDFNPHHVRAGAISSNPVSSMLQNL